MRSESGFERGYFSQEVFDDGQIQSVEALRARIGQVPDEIAKWSRISKAGTQSQSELAFDDMAAGWFRVSGTVTLALHQAADALQALHRLIPPEGGTPLPLVSHYAVARSGLEAASLALWILGPADPRERLRRHLLNIQREVVEETKLFTFAIRASSVFPELSSGAVHDRQRKEMKAWKKKRQDLIREVSSSLGLSVPTDGRTVGFAEIVREATAITGLPGGHGEMVWREISGLVHPSFSRSIRSMERDVVAGDDKDYQVIMSGRTSLVRVAVEATLLQFSEAVSLLGRRKVQKGSATQYQRPHE